MIQRCTNPKNIGWHLYGGRGIAVCERWRTFANFYEDMGDPPPGHTLDRINNDGNYEPMNVRWAPHSENCLNKRFNRRITWNAKTQTLGEWSVETGIAESAIRKRLRSGWSVELALSAPASGAVRNRNPVRLFRCCRTERTPGNSDQKGRCIPCRRALLDRRSHKAREKRAQSGADTEEARP